MQNSPAVVVHFYRATVMHADVWRRRLDATTNWSIISTAGLITYAFSDPTNPHVAILLAIPFLCVFLLMESRRYQMYDMWRYRVRLLNRYVVAPVLSAGQSVSEETQDKELLALSIQLGTSIPRLSIRDAIGYRIRRNYGYLFLAIILLWVIKLYAHPLGENLNFMEKVAVGDIPGWTTLVGVFSFATLASYLGARAPTEKMENWMELASPLERLLKRDRATTNEVSVRTLPSEE